MLVVFCATSSSKASLSARLAADDIARRTRLLDNEIRVMKDENQRLNLEHAGTKEKVKDNLVRAYVI